MSLTPAERAALSALLDRVRASTRLPNNETLLRPFLTDEQFARFKALKRRLSEPYLDRVAELPSIPMPRTVDDYAAQLGTSMNDFDYRSRDLKKMKDQVIALQQRIAEYEEYLATAKEGPWHRYEALTDEEKDWCADESQDGWPPLAVRSPPMSAMFPGEEPPVIKAARIILEEVLGEPTEGK